MFGHFINDVIVLLKRDPLAWQTFETNLRSTPMKNKDILCVFYGPYGRRRLSFCLGCLNRPNIDLRIEVNIYANGNPPCTELGHSVLNNCLT